MRTFSRNKGVFDYTYVPVNNQNSWRVKITERLMSLATLCIRNLETYTFSFIIHLDNDFYFI